MQWIVMAVLTAAASLAVLVPLFRRGSAGAGASASPIYRDQLDSLAKEAARGIIPPEEAEAARNEIARRLIRAEAETPSAAAPARRWPVMVAAAIGLVALPAGALALYARLGAPGFADMPLATRISGPVDQRDIAALIYRIETQLAANPDNAEGWRLIVRVYDSFELKDKAVNAYRQLARLDPQSADRQTDLGAAMVRAADGDISNEAMAVFETAMRLDPASRPPRLYHAYGLAQAGNNAEAIAELRAVLKDAPAAEPWVEGARRELARLEALPARGPSAADVAAAGNMTATDRDAMISGMVAGLAARLDAQPNDAEGWQQLIRSYAVLGRRDAAVAALGKARRTFASDQARLAAFDGLAQQLKLVE